MPQCGLQSSSWAGGTAHSLDLESSRGRHRRVDRARLAPTTPDGWRDVPQALGQRAVEGAAHSRVPTGREFCSRPALHRSRSTTQCDRASRMSGRALARSPSLLLLNKPFQVLTQFTSTDGKKTLKDFISAPSMRPAGRLDYDSEGLVLLTDSGTLQTRLADPRWKAPKTYIVQVEGTATNEALEPLRRGVDLAEGRTLPAEAQVIDEPEWLWPRTPPIRERKAIPTRWIS